MKQMAFLIAVLVGGSIFGAHDGLETAAKMCPDIGFSSDVTKCTQLVSSAEYFDESAVGVCAGFSFANKKLQCLESIKNKSFTPSLVTSCKGLSFDDKILNCLASAGKAHVGNPNAGNPNLDGDSNDSPSRRHIKRALHQLDKGNYGKVREILKDLLRETR
jgi:hypothetical protein